ncbi:MAG: OmpA family protein [Deltaproteobacteria bacterium]|nr:OmpA family protein [Deltaproteobacteria bacterium]
MFRAAYVLLFLTAVACVPKGKYDEAVLQNQALSQKVSELSGVVEEREATLRQLERTRDQLGADLADAQRRLSEKVAETGALQEDIEQMQQALAELKQRKAVADEALASFRDLVARFQSMIDAGTLKVKVIDGRMVVELATDILFPPGGATLSKDGIAAIAEVAAVLASIPDRDYQVAGHTDDQPIATERFPSNWHLGAARAIAVAQILIESGLSAERVSASSYAAYRPADTNKTREGRAINRRIEIVIMPDLSKLPGYDELQGMGGHS